MAFTDLGEGILELFGDAQGGIAYQHLLGEEARMQRGWHVLNREGAGKCARLVAAGKCRRCGWRPPKPGKHACANCLEKDRIYNQAHPYHQPPELRKMYREKYKAIGRCARCPNPAKPGRTRCEACTLKARKRQTAA